MICLNVDYHINVTNTRFTELQGGTIFITIFSTGVFAAIFTLFVKFELT